MSDRKTVTLPCIQVMLSYGDKERCSLCGRKSEYDCSHTVCPNRRPLTANVPDNCTHKGMSSGGYYRVSPTNKE